MTMRGWRPTDLRAWREVAAQRPHHALRRPEDALDLARVFVYVELAPATPDSIAALATAGATWKRTRGSTGFGIR